MLEIKCPYTRKILTKGNLFDICPKYYWVQIQLQLECCDLDECDFWQCKITEYDNREDFNYDTNPIEQYKSKHYKHEKGCVIQLLPKERMNDTLNGKYNEVVYDCAKFLYPPKIDMTPLDNDIWIAETLQKINSDPEYLNYYFDKVLYWRIEKTSNITINRDRKWFAEKLPLFRKMWDYVLYFRKYPDKFKIFNDYINSMKLKINTKIMDIVEKICNEPSKDSTEIEINKYNLILEKIIDETKLNEHMKEEKLKEQRQNIKNNQIYMF